MDLAEIQAAYYMVAATGVLVAAIYYIVNMRATRKNMNLTLETRRISLIDNLTTRIMNREGMRNYFELMNYEWKDYEASRESMAQTTTWTPPLRDTRY